jgi:hypothetical protein
MPAPPVYVLSECTASCVNDRFSAVANYLSRYVAAIPEVIWIGRVAVAGITRQVYALPAMIFVLVLIGLWYILTLLFDDTFLRPHPECSELTHVEFPEYHIYIIYANFTLSILHDIHWMGLRSSNLLQFLFKIFLICGVFIVPVLNGNLTPIQAMLSALIGVVVGAAYFMFMTVKWSAYYDLIERHPLLRWTRFKNTQRFRQEWFM